MGRSIFLLGVAVALLVPSAPALAQSGGTPVPGPGDPCPASYPGDDADREPIARWMARGAALREVPQELPAMAGLAESGLRNLNTKGNPFAGFFSMHRSLNKGDYRGFPRNPELQLRWFLDTAVIVRQREIAEGEEDFGSSPDGYGVWIADVERPTPENRKGYQPYFDDADALLTESCRPSDHVADETPPALRIKAAGRQRDAVVVTARCPSEPCMVAAQAEPRRRVRAARAVSADADAVTLTLPVRARRSVRLVVTVTAVDVAGNASRRTKSVILLR
ncbi:MAG: hypothetical protein QOD71_3453 [Thermoleophilaceae bacterium]|nr:hypothetical protein [Thermoleophilaceae bacterium]